ncbi:MAG: 1-acyl-sn-glycerol-3-phosphate acyltransferase [Turicibacter sp.]|nr:1-acyl-sn-glycerol-3-phosphate acyltransferase [Turicibacter sp.]
MFSILLWIVAVIVGIAALLGLIVVLLNLWFIVLGKDKYTDAQRWGAIKWIVSWAVPLLTFSRTEMEGLEKLSDEQLKTGVVYANHQSIFDIFTFVKTVKRRHAYIAKVEIGRIFLLNRGMRLIRCGFLDRDNPRLAVQTMYDATKAVTEGILMVIFPEGTRIINGPMGGFKAGSFKVAVKAKAAIVPTTIYNSHMIGKRWPLPTTVKIKIHDPIPYEDYKGMSTAAIAKMVEGIIKADLL